MYRLNPKLIRFNKAYGKDVYAYEENYQEKGWVIKVNRVKEPKLLQMCLHEIALGLIFNHPHVLPVKGYCIEYQEPQESPFYPELWNIYIKLPQMDFSLKDIIKKHVEKNQSVPETKIIEYLYAIVQGLRYLHDMNISNRDIKPSNILIGEDGSIRISDFGLGIFIMRDSSSILVDKRQGTLHYMAPELLDSGVEFKKKDLMRTDLWSLGILLLELCGIDIEILKKEELNDKLEELKTRYSSPFLSLISGLLNFEPSQRIQLKEIQEILERKYADLVLPIKQKIETNVTDPLETAKLREKQKEIELKLFEELKKSREYEDKIKDLQTKLSEVENERSILEIKFQEMQEKLILHESEKVEMNRLYEEKINILEMSLAKASKKSVKSFEADIKQKWGDLFIFQNETEKEISVQTKKFKRIEENTMKKFMEAITLDSKYQALERLSLDLNKWENTTMDTTIREVSFQVCSKMKNLLHFSLRAQSMGGRINDKTIETLAVLIGTNLMQIQKLSIDFADEGWSGEITDNGVEAIASHILGNLENIQDFSLNLKGHKKITTQGIEHVARRVQPKLQRITCFSLNFNECKKIADKGLEELAVQVSSLKSLHQLSLSFCGCVLVGDQAIKTIASNIGSNLLRLKGLNLLFSNCINITDEGLLELASQLSNIHDLQQLSLSFESPERITDEGFKKFALRVSQNFKNLEQLSLSFEDSLTITPQSVNQLIEGICFEMHNLKQLTLSFKHFGIITDDWFKKLKISNRPNNMTLHSLSFIFTESIKNRNKLFFINYSCGNLTDEGIQNLCSQIFSSYKELNNLSLDFSCCEKITDTGIRALSSKLAFEIKNIKHLAFDFSCCNKITGNGLKSLLDLCKNLKRLQAFSFSFKHWTNTNNLKGITTRVGSKLNNLKQLSLDFSRCTNMTERKITKLVLQISQNLKNLQKLSLNFSCIGSNPITQTDLENIVVQVNSNLQNLKEFLLNSEPVDVYL